VTWNQALNFTNVLRCRKNGVVTVIEEVAEKDVVLEQNCIFSSSSLSERVIGTHLRRRRWSL